MLILVRDSTLIRFVLLGWGGRGGLILVRGSTLIRFVSLRQVRGYHNAGL